MALHPSNRLARPGGAISKWVVAALLSVSLAACGATSKPAQYKTPWRLSSKSVVTVESRRANGAISFKKPQSGAGKGALYGAGAGIGGALEMGTGCEGFGCFIILPIMVGAGIVGAGVGAASSHSKASTDKATESVKQAIRDARPWESLERYVVGKGPIPPSGPNLRAGTAGRTLLVLETQMQFPLMGMPTDPDMVVVIRTTGTLKTPGAAPLGVSWTHTSKPYDFHNLAANDGKLLRDVIKAETAEMAKQIRQELALAVAGG